MAEFLPLCDLLFNVVSLAAYFCDLVFDLLVVYALYTKGLTVTFSQCLGAIILSTLVSQILSMHWYLRSKTEGWQKIVVIVLHILQFGVLWRYARLLVPVQLASVKSEVRDLCILRLVHGFLQAAPMLLLQLTLLPGNCYVKFVNFFASNIMLLLNTLINILPNYLANYTVMMIHLNQSTCNDLILIN